jgi:bifunctional UDP-N-acetylglucosamine pyrophosphorylase/glucosamine-1-phosphate N-acetyltransferase
MTASSDKTRTPLAAIILAAGKGTRMDSDLPKVVHKVAGKPMVQWVIDAVREAGADRVILVVGHGASIVKNEIPNCEYVLQEPQLGTGHAVLVCKDVLADFEGNILILGGDGPLLRASTVHEMVALQEKSSAEATLATSVIPNPTGYGRILRDETGKTVEIINSVAPEDILSINTPEQLNEVESFLLARINSEAEQTA